MFKVRNSCSKWEKTIFENLLKTILQHIASLTWSTLSAGAVWFDQSGTVLDLALLVHSFCLQLHLLVDCVVVVTMLNNILINYDGYSDTWLAMVTDASVNQLVKGGRVYGVFSVKDVCS